MAQELIFLGDGAAWIWHLVDQHYPQAVQIVDWFHAAAYLAPVAARAGPTAQHRQAWLQQVRADLWAGRVAEVIAACAAQVTPGDADDPAQKAVTYFTNNPHRMNYPAYRARGYQIGSGTIESGGKQIGTCRLKVPGASRHLAGARGVAKARAALLSNEWDELVQRRTHLAAAA